MAQVQVSNKEFIRDKWTSNGVRIFLTISKGFCCSLTSQRPGLDSKGDIGTDLLLAKAVSTFNGLIANEKELLLFCTSVLKFID